LDFIPGPLLKEIGLFGTIGTLVRKTSGKDQKEQTDLP